MQFEMIAKVLPAAKHVLLEAGHLLHREQPDAVAEHVNNFLFSSARTGTGLNGFSIDDEGK